MGTTGKGKGKGKGSSSAAILSPGNVEQVEKEPVSSQEPEEEKQKKPESEEEEFAKTPSNDENDLEGFTTFTNNYASTEKWFNNPKLSNMKDWEDNLLTADEKDTVMYYTGSGYQYLNEEMYNEHWDDMSSYQKKKAINLYEAINKFELNKGINTVRQCDFKIFGSKKTMTVDQVIDFLKNKTIDGHVQVDGFLSSTTKPSGTYADSHGLWIDIKTPPNKGGGAYVSDVGYNAGESEYLFNSNAVFKFDVNSVHKDSNGYVHVSAEWVGQAKDQAKKKKKK